MPRQRPALASTKLDEPSEPASEVHELVRKVTRLGRTRHVPQLRYKGKDRMTSEIPFPDVISPSRSVSPVKVQYLRREMADLAADFDGTTLKEESGSQTKPTRRTTKVRRKSLPFSAY
jgi:hypothetical protein